MIRIISGVFILLHGLVHLLYFGQSQRLIELQPELVWPDGSWAFSRLFGNETTRLLAGASCVLAALGFIAGGTGILASQRWWRPSIVGSAAFFTVMLFLLWNGRMQKLDDQGAICVLINGAILVAVLIFRWPDL